MAERPEKYTPSTGLTVRTATALALGAALLAVVLYAPPLGLAVAVAVISAFGVAEFYAMARHERRKPNELFGIAAAFAMPLAVGFFSHSGLIAVVTTLVVASLLWHLVFKQVRTDDTAITVFGAVYVGFNLSHLVLLRATAPGATLVTLVLLSVWANDVFAYFVGLTIGRHRLAPSISPHKSWEGFLGGVLAATLVWTAAYFVAYRYSTPVMSLPWYAAIGVSVGLAATIGDLVESRMKREAEVKDSGRSLPGHGGFLDRFDSMIMVSVVVFYMVFWAGVR